MGETNAPGSRRLRLIASIGAALVFLLIQFVGGRLETGQGGSGILDPDSYTRLLRVESLLEGQGWHDLSLPWSDAPDGGETHWTRPMDVVVAGIALPLSLGTDLHTAVTMAGFLVPVLFGMASIGCFAWFATRWLGFWAVALGLLAGLQPTLPIVFRWSYVDHHALQLFLFSLGVVAALRGLEREDADDSESQGLGAARLAGVCMGLGLWVSVEAQAWILPVIGLTALVWIVDGSRTTLRHLTSMASLAAIASMAGLAIERPARDWLTVETDRISIAQVSLLVALALFWKAGERLLARPDPGSLRLGQRLATAVLCISIPALVVLAVFPRLLRGPVDGVDPRVITILFDNNAEFTRFDPGDLLYLGQLAGSIGPSIIAILLCAALLVPTGGRDESHVARGVCILLIGLLFVFVPLSLYQWRWTTYVNLLSLLPWALAIRAVWKRGAGSGVTRRALTVIVVALLLLSHLAAAVGLSLANLRRLRARASVETQAEPRPRLSGPITPCSYDGLGERLSHHSGRSPEEISVMTTMYDGPQLVWETGVRVVGTPYHRNQKGILDTQDVMAGSDLARARDILETRRIDFVVVCPSGNSIRAIANAEPNSLGARLARGRSPQWLEPVVAEGAGALVFQVRDRE